MKKQNLENQDNYQDKLDELNKQLKDQKDMYSQIVKENKELQEDNEKLLQEVDLKWTIQSIKSLLEGKLMHTKWDWLADILED